MKKILFPILILLTIARLQAQNDFKVVGYWPYYRFSWINDIEFQRLTHVNIAFANPDSLGNFSVGGVSVTNAVNKAHQNGCKVFISLAGGYLTPTQEATWDYLTLPANRAFFIQKIVSYVQAKGFDGVDIDLEWQYVKSWYSPFILELKAALAPLGLPLTAALPGNYKYPQISNAALAAFDWVNMMIYDLTGPFNPNNPGQHSPYSWAVDCVQYWIDKNVPAQKLTLGVPFYGYNFGVSPVEALTYRYIVGLSPSNADMDQVNDIYYNGIPTIKAKTKLALDKVGGVMIWEIGQDAFGANKSYSLLRAIDEQIGQVTAVSQSEVAGLLIYPNPVGEALHLVFPEETNGLLNVSDLQGRMLGQWILDAQSRLDISTSSWPAGMYQLSWSNLERVQSMRFIKL
ncbi:MAG: T9SS type A sorting domain-containing protein [Bacteroidetes bacterium]|nr:T9SS type A sorting domain-containing protein [Bacteroidota bacterium]